mgnify:CR=1 FL=1
MQLFLSQPGILSSIGDSLSQHVQTLLEGSDSPLTFSNKHFQENGLQGKYNTLGEVNRSLRAFPADLPKKHHSRNNQLLWHSLEQIEPTIQKAISRFGRHRIAVVIGTSTTGVDENLPVFKYAAEHEDWSGAEFNACTSGAKALISAARLLNANLCDAVICGGVDTLSLLTLVGFNSLSVLSAEQTNPFSANRQGINLGEGSAVFVMSKEKLDDHNVALLGYGASSDAYHMSSPHPEGEGAIKAFQNALNSAKLVPEAINWVNLHGTGTIHNDQMEALAIHHIFGHDTPCTTTKPYTGHTLGAAGAIEAAILWGMIDRTFNPTGKLPAQLWDKQADEKMPPIAITDHMSHWTSERRIGASSSFAFGGNNSVLILGEVND